MRCLKPYLKKLFDRPIPGTHPTDFEVIEVPCGKCLACRINKRREWTTRLLNEEVYSSTSFFFTFTYRDDALPRDDNDNPAVCVRDVQLFLKRLRKKYGKGIRYFLNSEYSPNLRPHYHAIIFNLPESILSESKIIKRYDKGKYSVSFVNETITNIWSKGDVEFSHATKERCGYCAKYFVDRKTIPSFLVPNFTLVSRGGKNSEGGIGKRYALAISDKVKYNQSTSMLSPSSGLPQSLPRYYKDKIYNDEERKTLLDRYLSMTREIAPETQMVGYSEQVERNLERSMTFKNKKQKLL